MEFRFSKNPHFYLAMGLVVILILLLSESVIYKEELSTPLEPSSVHHAGPVRPVPFDAKLWESHPQLAKSILLGAEVFYHTQKFAPEFIGNALSCTQCHYNGGKQEGMLGLIGIAMQYPKYDPRAGREITLSERLQSCFLRSENGKAPPVDAPILQNLHDYVTALSSGQPAVKEPTWQNFVSIAKQDLIPIESLQPQRGKMLFEQKCAACHMSDGQGDSWAPPLWGKMSFNDGAGLARVYTLASFIRDAMPLSDPGALTPEAAQQIAAYIDAQDRPVFSGKDQDYLTEPIPVDAVYYTRRYPENPLRLSFEKK
jgi:thiosulfate dehydrogenase